MKDAIRHNIAQMTSRSKAYILCFLVIIIKWCHMISWNRLQASTPLWWSLRITWKTYDTRTYQKRLTNRSWKGRGRLCCSNSGGEFKSMNSSSIVYTYLSTPIGKLFLASIFLFCSLPIKSWCHKFFELSLAITTTVLKPVLCDHMTSFNYDDKKARHGSVTCWCHLSNIMPDSIFHKSMRQGITCSVSFCLFVFPYLFVVCLIYLFIYLFCGVILLFSSGWKKWNSIMEFLCLCMVCCF